MQSEDKIKCLADAIKISDHSAIYEHSKHLLKEHPDDIEYQQCHILSAIKLNRNEELSQLYFKQPPTH